MDSSRALVFLRQHLRLFVCALLGATTGLLLPAQWGTTLRSVVGWDVAAFVYIAVASVMLTRADEKSIRKRAEEQDDGALMALLIVVAAAGLSLAAIFIAVAQAKAARAGIGWPAAAAIVTVVLSWTLCHTVFAIHYAHEYYNERRKGSGLDFPGEEAPDYWDFVYFSFVIGMTFQVSDVAVSDRVLRRLVVAHGAIAFFFNTAIVALTVNIAASAI